MDRRRVFLLTLRGLAVFSVALVITWLALPSPIGSLAWIPSPAPALDGPYRMNELLRAAERRHGELPGPEDVAFDAEGHAYSGLADGRIVRFDGAALENPTEVVHTGGRPLGLAFSPTDGLLYVGDADRGLLRVDTAKKTVEVVVNAAEGDTFRFTNEVVIARDGTVYFTVSSTVWGRHKYTEDLLDQRPTGRVLRFDPKTGATTVLARELSFANGLVLMPDERSLIVAETGRYRLWRLWLDGDKRNLKEVITENLPGFPDNLSLSPRGTIWIGMASTRKRLLDAIHPHPFLKDATASLPPSLRPQPVRWGFVLEVDADGHPMRSLQDTSGDVISNVTSVVERDGRLYLGNLDQQGLAVVALPAP